MVSVEMVMIKDSSVELVCRNESCCLVALCCAAEEGKVTCE